MRAADRPGAGREPGRGGHNHTHTGTRRACRGRGADEPYAAELHRVRLAYGFVSTTDIPIWIADDQRLWQQYGLAVEPTLLQTNAQIAPAMAAGEVDVALTAGAGVVHIDLAGGDQVLIASLQNELSFFVHAQPNIQRVEDLRRQKLGITRRGSGINLAADIVLKKAGLEPGRNVALQAVGTVQNELSALTSGHVAAVTLSTPTNFLAERQGYPQIADLSHYHVPYSQGALAVTRNILAERYALVRDFVKAFVEGLGLAKRNPALAQRVLGQNTQTSVQDLLDKSYTLWLSELDWTLDPSVAAVQTVLDQRAGERPAAKTAKAEDSVDRRIVDELQSSGFFAQALGAQHPAAEAH